MQAKAGESVRAHLADIGAKPVGAETVEDEPEFDGAKSVPETELPVSVVDGGVGSAWLERRKGGVTSSMSVRCFWFRTQSVDMSKLVRPHWIT